MQTAAHRTTDRALLLLGITVSAAALLRVLGNSLVWDDRYLITRFDGLGDVSRLGEVLTSPFWDSSSYVAGDLPGYWRPVTSLVLWIGGLLFGSWEAGFHLLSLVAVAAAAAGLGLLVRRIVSSPGERPLAFWIPVLFLIHPLSAEVVSQVANLSDHLVLAFLAVQVTLLVEAVHRGRTRAARWVLVGAAALLASGAKEVGIVACAAPAVAWLLVRSADPSLPPGRLARPLPWIASAGPVALYLGVRAWVVGGAQGAASSGAPFPATAWLLGWGQALARALVPIPGGAHSYVRTDQASTWLVTVLAWAVVVTLAVAAVRRRSASLGLTGCLVALALLLPSLLTVETSGATLRFPNRYFHLPLAGLLLAALPLLRSGWARGLRLAVPVLAVLLAGLSWVRIGDWRDEVTFFSVESIHNPDSPRVLLSLADALTDAGAFTEAGQVIARLETLPAADHAVYRAGALRVQARAVVLRDGDLEEGSRLLLEAVRTHPRDLTNALDLARLRDRSGHPEQAVTLLDSLLAAPWLTDRDRSLLEHHRTAYLP